MIVNSAEGMMIMTAAEEERESMAGDGLSQINKASHLSSHHPSVIGEMQALNMNTATEAHRLQNQEI